MGDSAVTWRVTYQQQGYDTTPGSPIIPGWTVGFVVNDRTQGSVFIAATDYTPDVIKARIAAKAREIAAVDALTHGS